MRGMQLRVSETAGDRATVAETAENKEQGGAQRAVQQERECTRSIRKHSFTAAAGAIPLRCSARQGCVDDDDWTVGWLQGGRSISQHASVRSAGKPCKVSQSQSQIRARVRSEPEPEPETESAWPQYCSTACDTRLGTYSTNQPGNQAHHRRYLLGWCLLEFPGRGPIMNECTVPQLGVPLQAERRPIHCPLTLLPSCPLTLLPLVALTCP